MWVLASRLGIEVMVEDTAVEATRSQRQSANRAIHRLVQEGLVETAKVSFAGRSRLVARARNPESPSQVSAESDAMLHAAMRLNVALYNDIAPRLGSRVRLETYMEDVSEGNSWIIDPISGQRHRGFFIYDRSDEADRLFRGELVKETADILKRHLNLEDLLKALVILARAKTPDALLD